MAVSSGHVGGTISKAALGKGKIDVLEAFRGGL
jgi:hypothetical protein